VTPEEAQNLEKGTREQSSSIKWHNYRKGHVTASVFYDVCHTSVKNPRRLRDESMYSSRK